MDIEKVLAGSGGPEGVLTLLSFMGRKVVRDELTKMMSAPEKLGACVLRRVRFNFAPELKLWTCYSVRLRGQSGNSTRAVTVIWKPRWLGKADKGGPKPEAMAIEAEASRRGLAEPFDRLTSRVPEWGMRVCVSPFDVRFPHLVRVSDPEHIRSTPLGAGFAREACSAPGSPDHLTVTSIRYYPGKRHVLRYDARSGRVPSSIFAKVYNSEKGNGLFQISVRAAERFAESGTPAAPLTPLAYVEDDRVVLYPCARGVPLQITLRRRERELGPKLELAGRALSVLHAASPSIAGLVKPHSFEEEMKKVVAASRHIAVLLPSAGATLGKLLDRARELNERLPHAPPAFTHGDTKLEHFWFTPRGVTLIDFDNCHWSDPELDAGKLLADLRFWEDELRHGELGEAQERFLAGYFSRRPTLESMSRVRLYEALELVQIIAYHVPLSDRDWAARITRLLDQADHLLQEIQGHGGLHKPSAQVAVAAEMNLRAAAAAKHKTPGNEN